MKSTHKKIIKFTVQSNINWFYSSLLVLTNIYKINFSLIDVNDCLTLNNLVNDTDITIVHKSDLILWCASS